MSEQMRGGWSNFNFTLTPDAKEAFESALTHWVGAKYTALAFASQLVNGTNYCFLCEVQYVTRFSNKNAAKVYIHQPLKGKPVIHKIVPVNP